MWGECVVKGGTVDNLVGLEGEERKVWWERRVRDSVLLMRCEIERWEWNNCNSRSPILGCDSTHFLGYPSIKVRALPSPENICRGV